MAVALHDREEVRAALAPWIAARLSEHGGPRVSDLELSALESPASGQSNETALFSATWSQGWEVRQADFVLRRQPTSNRLFLDVDVILEFKTMAALQQSRVPVPSMLWAEPSPDVLGAPFFVMSKVEGIVPFGRPSIHVAGWLPTLTPGQRHRVWESGLSVLAAVHNVDWSRTHPFLTVKVNGRVSLAHYVDRLKRYYTWATEGRPFPVTDAVLAYLEDNLASVESGPPVLVWGDARVGNMIFREDLSVAAAIDWETATVGPAEIDLGHWLMFDDYYTQARGVKRLEGIPDRAATIDLYQSLSGRPVADPEYCELLAGLMLATTLIRKAGIQVQRGDLPASTRLGHDNVVTRMLARRLGLPIPEMSDDYQRVDTSKAASDHSVMTNASSRPARTGRGGVEVEFADGVLTVGLNRAEKRNALDRATRADLAAIWQRFQREPGLRCLVLTAKGETFCAGADLDELAAVPRPSPADGFDASLRHLPSRWLAVPVVCAVNGPCVGMGLDLVADADMVVACPQAWFSDPHVSIGHVTAMAPLLLSARLPAPVVTKMVLLGARFRLSAAEALQHGFVAEVVPPDEVRPRADAWARQIAEASPAAIRRSVKFLRSLQRDEMHMRLDEAWAAASEHWSHPDAAEGPLAFRQHRTPRWSVE
jgi:enoyl-CoA hydratase/carnithine racemase/aminoglycoside phosphotransferase (APT) family kinase protein